MKLEADGWIVVCFVMVVGLVAIVSLLLRAGAEPSAVTSLVERVLATVARH
ncbi:MAG: hypothetical protein JWN15_1310 [Firmicutes bacterium]|jgi:nicotinamide riboside transporter PnuC|nr:hypothetical protein [Bacillota bacterium]